EHEGLAVILLRPPLAQAGGEIGAAGQRRVIGAGPAAQGDLHHQQAQADPQQPAQAISLGQHQGAAGRGAPASQTNSERVSRPPSRCAITMTGLTSQITVHMPSTAWKMITMNSAVASREASAFDQRSA